MPLSVYIWKVKYLFKARIINNNWLYFSNTELWFSIVDNIWSLILKIYWIGEVEVWTSKCLLFQVMTFIKLLCVFNAYILPFIMCITVKYWRTTGHVKLLTFLFFFFKILCYHNKLFPFLRLQYLNSGQSRFCLMINARSRQVIMLTYLSQKSLLWL